MQNKKKFDIFSLSSYLVLLAILVVFGIFGNNFLTLKSIYATINNGLPLILILQIGAVLALFISTSKIVFL